MLIRRADSVIAFVVFVAIAAVLVMFVAAFVALAVSVP